MHNYENDKNGKPFFTAKVIDKVYSMQHTTFMFNAYSWSNMDKGMTNFRICCDDFEHHFPRCFEQLSYNLSKEKNPNDKFGLTEFYISPEFEKSLEKETGKTLDEYLDEQIEKGKFDNLRINRKHENK